MKEFRNDTFYFCAFCQQNFIQNTQLKENARLLQTMMEGLYRCVLNMSQLRSQYGVEMAVKRSQSRQMIKSPNRINVSKPS